MNIDDHLMKNYIEPGKLSGAMTCIYRHGKPLRISPLGMADLERGIPTQRNTIYRIYSMTKPVTSVALMMLFEEGKFQLDDPVATFIPEWSNMNVYKSGKYPHFEVEPCKKEMTIRHLLTHTSGLTYGFIARTPLEFAYQKLGIGSFDRSYQGSFQELTHDLSTLPLLFEPGTSFNYSVSTDICGYLIEKISGIPFQDFLRTRIFEPLEMVDTDFYVPPEKISRFAANYDRGPDMKLRLYDDPLKSRFQTFPKLVGGGGGLVSTIDDYLNFCKMLLKGGGGLLSPKTIECMWTNQLPGGMDIPQASVSLFRESEWNGVQFGLGFSIRNGTFSWGGAASTTFWIDPKEEMIVILMTQFFPSYTYKLAQELQSLVYLE